MATNAISLGGEILTFDVMVASTDSSEAAVVIETVSDTSNMVVTEDDSSISSLIGGSSSSATSSYSSDADYGFSTSEAMAAFAAVAMPTAYLLNKNPQVIEVINELYNNYEQGGVEDDPKTEEELLEEQYREGELEDFDFMNDDVDEEAAGVMEKLTAFY